jgi:dUTP pyrophosphatase
MTAGRFERVSRKQYDLDRKNFETGMPLEQIPLPVRATAGSAGYDMVCPVDVEIGPGQRVVVPTGIRVQVREGYFLMLCPRSSMGRKYGLRLSNTLGIVDSDYYGAENEGHILLTLEHAQPGPVQIRAGERICQAIFVPFGLAEDDHASSIRQGGYGSTGV